MLFLIFWSISIFKDSFLVSSSSVFGALAKNHSRSSETHGVIQNRIIGTGASISERGNDRIVTALDVKLVTLNANARNSDGKYSVIM